VLGVLGEDYSSNTQEVDIQRDSKTQVFG